MGPNRVFCEVLVFVKIAFPCSRELDPARGGRHNSNQKSKKNRIKNRTAARIISFSISGVIK